MPAPHSPALRVLVLMALWVGPSLAEEPAPTPLARVHFKAGVAALEGEQWQTAYREFKSAYAITPRWTILGNLGIAAWHLERDGEAIDAMAQYLARGGAEISAAEATQVRATIGRLQAEVATVTIEANREFWIGDTRTGEGTVANEYGPFPGRTQLRLRPGQHTLELKRVGVDVPAWSATLSVAEVKSVSFVIPSPPSPRIQQALPSVPDVDRNTATTGPSHTASYVLWGSGAAVGLAAGGFLLHARDLQQEADRNFARQCPDGATGLDGCDRTTGASKRAASWRTAALGTGVGALGALVTGTVLYFVADSASSDEQATDSALQPWITGGKIGVSGTF